MYPDITLKIAREKRDELRRMVAQGIDPSAHRKAMKASQQESAANSFELVAREWHTKFKNQWVPSHADRIFRRLESDLIPWLGSRPVSEITPLEILNCVRRIEKRGARNRKS